MTIPSNPSGDEPTSDEVEDIYEGDEDDTEEDEDDEEEDDDTVDEDPEVKE